jgi:hypothetical protein
MTFEQEVHCEVLRRNKYPARDWAKFKARNQRAGTWTSEMEAKRPHFWTLAEVMAEMTPAPISGNDPVWSDL